MLRILSIELMTAAQALSWEPRKTSEELELMLSDFRSGIPFVKRPNVYAYAKI